MALLACLCLWAEDGCTVRQTLSLSYNVTSLSCQYLSATIYSLVSVTFLRIIQRLYSFSLLLGIILEQCSGHYSWYTQLLPGLHASILWHRCLLWFLRCSLRCVIYFQLVFQSCSSIFQLRWYYKFFPFYLFQHLACALTFSFAYTDSLSYLWFLHTLSSLITYPVVLEMYEFITFPKNYPVWIYFHSFCVFTQLERNVQIHYFSKKLSCMGLFPFFLCFYSALWPICRLASSLRININNINIIIC